MMYQLDHRGLAIDPLLKKSLTLQKEPAIAYTRDFFSFKQWYVSGVKCEQFPNVRTVIMLKIVNIRQTLLAIKKNRVGQEEDGLLIKKKKLPCC